MRLSQVSPEMNLLDMNFWNQICSILKKQSEIMNMAVS